MKPRDLYRVQEKNLVPFHVVPVGEQCQVFTWNGRPPGDHYQSIFITKMDAYSGYTVGTKKIIVTVQEKDLVGYRHHENSET